MRRTAPRITGKDRRRARGQKTLGREGLAQLAQGGQRFLVSAAVKTWRPDGHGGGVAPWRNPLRRRHAGVVARRALLTSFGRNLTVATQD